MNKEADELANLAMDKKSSLCYVAPHLFDKINLGRVSLQAWSDGGHRAHGNSAGAAVVKAWHSNHSRPYVLVAMARFTEDTDVDSTCAEVIGLQMAIAIVHRIVSQGRFTERSVIEISKDPTIRMFNSCSFD